MKMLHYPDKVNKTVILSDAIVLSNLWISMIVHTLYCILSEDGYMHYE